MTIAAEEELRRIVAEALEQRAAAAAHPQAWWLNR